MRKFFKEEREFLRREPDAFISIVGVLGGLFIICHSLQPTRGDIIDGVGTTILKNSRSYQFWWFAVGCCLIAMGIRLWRTIVREFKQSKQGPSS